MNQPIKFRIWGNTPPFAWAYPASFFLNPDGQLYHLWQDKLEIVDEKIWIVQRATGLLDKNGKEIYEGDILNLEVVPMLGEPSCDDGKRNNMVVWWNEQTLNWCFGKWKSRRAGIEYDAWYTLSNFLGDILRTETFEVVGNIFENKELLDHATIS